MINGAGNFFQTCEEGLRKASGDSRPHHQRGKAELNHHASIRGSRASQCSRYSAPGAVSTPPF